MQWLLQDFEDTRRLAAALDAQRLPYSWHKVVPFVGDLLPAPDIADPDAVVLFGAYTLRTYAERHGLWPGVIRLRPFIEEPAWQTVLLNGPEATLLRLRDLLMALSQGERPWFVRPVADGKELPGRVRTERELLRMAEAVLALREDEIPVGSLRHDTLLMLSRPVWIGEEWRVWIVGDRVVAHSLYKSLGRVVYRPEIDADALAFAQRVVACNPGYAPAYVMDICRTGAGLRLLETNCINAAGFYAADLTALVMAMEALARTG